MSAERRHTTASPGVSCIARNEPEVRGEAYRR